MGPSLAPVVAARRRNCSGSASLARSRTGMLGLGVSDFSPCARNASSRWTSSSIQNLHRCRLSNGGTIEHFIEVICFAWRQSIGFTVCYAKCDRLDAPNKHHSGMAIMRHQVILASVTAMLFAVVAAGERPAVKEPRVTSGDTAVEPDWKQKLTITVGPKGDLAGSTDKVIQAGVDYVARLGGGTVKVLPGTYRLRNSIFLQSNVRLIGSGTDSVLFKEPSVTTKITVDGDHWDQEITVADPGGFEVGDGVRLVSKDPYGKGVNIVQRTLIAARGNRFKLDRRLEERFHL